MREIRTSGSVGALGRQLPRATRPRVPASPRNAGRGRRAGGSTGEGPFSRAQSIALITKSASSAASTISNLTIPPGNTRLRTQRSSGDGPASAACALRRPRHSRIF